MDLHPKRDHEYWMNVPSEDRHTNWAFREGEHLYSRNDVSVTVVFHEMQATLTYMIPGPPMNSPPRVNASASAMWANPAGKITVGDNPGRTNIQPRPFAFHGLYTERITLERSCSNEDGGK